MAMAEPQGGKREQHVKQETAAVSARMSVRKKALFWLTATVVFFLLLELTLVL